MVVFIQKKIEHWCATFGVPINDLNSGGGGCLKPLWWVPLYCIAQVFTVTRVKQYKAFSACCFGHFIQPPNMQMQGRLQDHIILNNAIMLFIIIRSSVWCTTIFSEHTNVSNNTNLHLFKVKKNLIWGWGAGSFPKIFLQ